ncbi:hypothetical protein J6590_025345 [Homalodisca vitripennis]|nr:hypothetical protein J6590_025345 [Homalodisca vitripennis]
MDVAVLRSYQVMVVERHGTGQNCVRFCKQNLALPPHTYPIIQILVFLCMTLACSSLIHSYMAPTVLCVLSK